MQGQTLCKDIFLFLLLPVLCVNIIGNINTYFINNQADSGFGVNYLYHKFTFYIIEKLVIIVDISVRLSAIKRSTTIAYLIMSPQAALKILEDERTIFYIFGDI